MENRGYLMHVGRFLHYNKELSLNVRSNTLP
jgi:hypothetical protein